MMELVVHEGCGGHFGRTLMGKAKCNKCDKSLSDEEVTAIGDNDPEDVRLFWGLVKQSEEEL